MAYRCPIHPRRNFSTYESLYQHAINSNEYHHCCSICERVFVGEKALENHTADKHGFICATCNKHFHSRSGLEQHAADKHAYRCETCDRDFNSESSMEQHNMDKHNYVCGTCDKHFHSQSAMEQHAEDKHTHRCETCDKDFNSESAIEQHNMDKHNYVCEVCDRYFYSQYAMEQHNTAKHSYYTWPSWSNNIRPNVSDVGASEPDRNTSDLHLVPGDLERSDSDPSNTSTPEHQNQNQNQNMDVGTLTNTQAQHSPRNLASQLASVSTGPIFDHGLVHPDQNTLLQTETKDTELQDVLSESMVVDDASNSELPIISSDGRIASPKTYAIGSSSSDRSSDPTFLESAQSVPEVAEQTKAAEHSPSLPTCSKFSEQLYTNTVSWLEQKFIALRVPARSSDVFQESVERMRGLDLVSRLSESSHYRTQLIEFSSNLNIYGHPELRDALRKDEAQMLHLIRHVLSSDTSEQAVLHLREEKAMIFLDLLCIAMKDKSFSEDPSALRKARRLRHKLSNACHLMPDSLRLEGVHVSDREAVHHGGFADIFKGSYKGRDVAVKRLRVTQRTQGDHNIQKALVREALVWEHLQHPYVLPFLGMDSDNFLSHLPCIVIPWMNNGMILDHIQNNVPLSVGIDPFILEVAQGLSYLHSRNVVHGDLRGNNILIDDDWHVRLADFGLADYTETTLATHTVSEHGAKRWMAPELFDPDSKFQRTTETDMYSFGCVCLEIYTGKHPFSDIQREEAAMVSVMRGDHPPRPSNDLGRIISDEFWHIIELCWSRKAADRPNVNDVLGMMKKIDFGALH